MDSLTAVVVILIMIYVYLIAAILLLNYRGGEILKEEEKQTELLRQLVNRTGTL